MIAHLINIRWQDWRSKEIQRPQIQSPSVNTQAHSTARRFLSLLLVKDAADVQLSVLCLTCAFVLSHFILPSYKHALDPCFGQRRFWARISILCHKMAKVVLGLTRKSCLTKAALLSDLADFIGCDEPRHSNWMQYSLSAAVPDSRYIRCHLYFPTAARRWIPPKRLSHVLRHRRAR